MARKQIVQFTSASAIAATDRLVLQQGTLGTAFTHGSVTQILNAGLASTFSGVTVNGTTTPTNGISLAGTNTLGISVAGTNEVLITASALSPAASDGLALGTSALMFSDVFLADGGVINFNNGNVTITHSAGALATNADVTLTGNLTQSRSGTITAAGTSQATATALTADINIVTAATAGQGVVLADQDALVLNRGTVDLLVYPPSGAQIETLGTDAAGTLVANTGGAQFRRASSTLFRVE